MKQISLFVSFCLILAVHQSFAQTEKKEIPMNEDHWEFPEGTVEFIEHNSFRAMKILSDAGRVTARDMDFATGTIEFDVEIGDFPFVGFSFHRQSDDEEWFYFRSYAAGNPAAPDAIQYAPIVHGVTLWDLYPTFQGPADFRKGEWTHVKLVIGEYQMRVYVNEKRQADLTIPYLEGEHKNGGISFNGEAIFANLVIQPGSTEGLKDLAGFDPLAHDPRYIRNWSVTSPLSFPMGREVIDKDLPGDNANWRSLSAERQGIVNLSREFGASPDGSRRLVWLKTKIRSAENQTRTLSLGFSDEVWVLINGQLLHVDKNYYRLPIMKQPGGRCSLENTSFEVPLLKGDNELLIGVGNFFFGWGIIARWDKLEHLVLE